MVTYLVLARKKKKKRAEEEKAVLGEKKRVVLQGYIDNVTGVVIGLIVGLGVAILVMIFVGVIGGQAYQTAEVQIQNITNAQIRDSITGAVVSGFKALNLTGQYLPIVVLAVIIGIVLAVIFTIIRPATPGGYYYGGVL